MTLKSKAIVLRADAEPMPGMKNPGTHQLYRNPRITLEERSLGALHSEEIRVNMLYAGLCGTDLHMLQTDPVTGYVRSSAPANIPPEGRLFGHEGVARVEGVGSHVKNVQPGDVVSFASIAVCNYCDPCCRGQFNQCQRASLLGLEKDGLFGTIVDVPAMLAHDVSDIAYTDAGLRAAACFEPAGVAYNACENARVTPGDVVVVFGGGPIGLLGVMLSRLAFGASQVFLVEPLEFRRNFAMPWCDALYDVESFFAQSPRVDVVIEASGDLTNVTRSLVQLNANGRVVMVGRSGKPLEINTMDHVITNQIKLIGSRGHLGGALYKIHSLFKSGRIPLHQIVTTVLSGPNELVDLLEDPRSVYEQNCKVLCKLDKLQ